MSEMATNYYAVKGEWPSAGEFESIKLTYSGRPAMIHVGKSTGGWSFALHVYPDMNIHTLNDWKALADRLIADGWHFEDEYKAEISPEALWRVVERADYKESDLQHLRRSKPSPGYCLGQGEGYYDYITGNFS